MSHNLQPETVRPSVARWRKFYSIIDFLKMSGPRDRVRFFNIVVLKAMIYGSEAWSPKVGDDGENNGAEDTWSVPP